MIAGMLIVAGWVGLLAVMYKATNRLLAPSNLPAACTTRQAAVASRAYPMDHRRPTMSTTTNPTVAEALAQSMADTPMRDEIEDLRKPANFEDVLFDADAVGRTVDAIMVNHTTATVGYVQGVTYGPCATVDTEDGHKYLVNGHGIVVEEEC